MLWDIDRTLVYTGQTDRQVYRLVFEELVGRPAERLPAKGTGVTVPKAVRQLLTDNNVAPAEIESLLPRFLDALPGGLEALRDTMLSTGYVLPGAPDALKAVANAPDLVATVLTGNLRASALIKLAAFGLSQYVQADIGAYSSDSAHRPALVAVSQRRAEAAHNVPFTHANTVIIGDSLEDVRTGAEGGARVLGVASGTTTETELGNAGADLTLPTLEDPGAVLEAVHRLAS